MAELPTPISDQDKLLSNIAIGTPDIEDLIPNSRQEIYLKYIAMNGKQGTYESPVAIENGGTGATTVIGARQNLGIMHRAWLYSNSSGTTGTVTLNDSAFNYKYIEIFFRTGVYFRGSVMLDINGSQIISGMNFINPTSGFAYCDARTIVINGTSITNGDTGHFGVENDKTYSNSGNGIYITRVLGYSYDR